MKKLTLILLTIIVAACSSNNTTDEEKVREVAKTDIVKELNLPEGTKFTDESIEITRNPEVVDGPNVEYIVKVTVKSENEAGDEIVKVYKMHYKKIADAEAAKDQFELTSFE